MFVRSGELFILANIFCKQKKNSFLYTFLFLYKGYKYCGICRRNRHGGRRAEEAKQMTKRVLLSRSHNPHTAERFEVAAYMQSLFVEEGT
jgi:hypothetical protein